MALHSLWLSSVVALAWSATECSEEESLMQGQAHQRIQLTGHSRADSNVHNVSGSQLLESVKRMVGTVNSAQPGLIDDATLQSLDVGISAANDVIIGSWDVIGQEHDAAQSRIDIAGAAMGQCLSSSVTGRPAVHGFGDMVQTKRTSHSTCRHTQSDLSAARTTSCDAMQNFMDTTELNLQVGREDADTFASSLESVRTQASNTHTTFLPLKEACETAASEAEAHGYCVTQQVEFEEVHCQLKTVCSAFEECWNREKAELDQIIDVENADMDRRQNQYTLLGQGRCLLDHIMAAISSGEQITSQGMQDCEGFSDIPETLTAFSLPDRSTPADCVETTASPAVCSTSFLDAEYSDFLQREEIEEACTACPRVEPSGSPAMEAGCAGQIDGGGWQLVRHQTAGRVWHPATDQLAGTDVYGDAGGGPLSDAAWSVAFSDVQFNQFLFATGDCENWLVATKDSVIGEYYAGNPRPVLKSSENPNSYEAKWYNLEGDVRFPAVGMGDYSRGILYMAGSYGWSSGADINHMANLEEDHQGANVLIRQA